MLKYLFKSFKFTRLILAIKFETIYVKEADKKEDKKISQNLFL